MQKIACFPSVTHLASSLLIIKGLNRNVQKLGIEITFRFNFMSFYSRSD